MEKNNHINVLFIYDDRHSDAIIFEQIILNFLHYTIKNNSDINIYLISTSPIFLNNKDNIKIFDCQLNKYNLDRILFYNKIDYIFPICITDNIKYLKIPKKYFSYSINIENKLNSFIKKYNIISKFKDQFYVDKENYYIPQNFMDGKRYYFSFIIDEVSNSYLFGIAERREDDIIIPTISLDIKIKNLISKMISNFAYDNKIKSSIISFEFIYNDKKNCNFENISTGLTYFMTLMARNNKVSLSFLIDNIIKKNPLIDFIFKNDINSNESIQLKISDNKYFINQNLATFCLNAYDFYLFENEKQPVDYKKYDAIIILDNSFAINILYYIFEALSNLNLKKILIISNNAQILDNYSQNIINFDVKNISLDDLPLTEVEVLINLSSRKIDNINLQSFILFNEEKIIENHNIKNEDRVISLFSEKIDDNRYIVFEYKNNGNDILINVQLNQFIIDKASHFLKEKKAIYNNLIFCLKFIMTNDNNLKIVEIDFKPFYEILLISKTFNINIIQFIIKKIFYSRIEYDHILNNNIDNCGIISRNDLKTYVDKTFNIVYCKKIYQHLESLKLNKNIYLDISININNFDHILEKIQELKYFSFKVYTTNQDLLVYDDSIILIKKEEIDKNTYLLRIQINNKNEISSDDHFSSCFWIDSLVDLVHFIYVINTIKKKYYQKMFDVRIFS